ncbi:sialidase family protein [Loktanella sp. DJP18]|uniref:sialidase family protein n=1 Tax=Loktanella sp. DJP18 TaxID=3409788 RepID=UPI003BB52CCE
MTRGPLVSLIAGLSLSFAGSPGAAQVFSTLAEVDVPSTGVVEEPSLVTLADGRVLMSWTELSGDTFAKVETAIYDGATWSAPVTVAEGDDLFINYADFSSAVGLPDGRIAVSWLRMNGDSYYDYDVNIAISGDGGQTWDPPIVPHRDGLVTQHGFVTLLPDANDGLLAMWLDGRAYDTGDTFGSDGADAGAMQLRATTVSADRTLSDDLLLDDRTCTCCQTSAAVTGDGTVLLAYRDRTADEVRDISVVRRVDGSWTKPQPVSGDGWEIDGCPVNGPAIAARGDHAALVWFTGAGGVPAVKMAFSDDQGASFGAARQIDLGGPAGRVDLLQLEDGSALVSWVEWTPAGEVLLTCRATAADGCGDPVAIAVNPTGNAMGFPRMTLAGDDVYIAWTEPSVDATGRPDGGTAIRVASGKPQLSE